MTSKLHVKVGAVELDFEGEDDFLKADILPIFKINCYLNLRIMNSLGNLLNQKNQRLYIPSARFVKYSY